MRFSFAAVAALVAATAAPGQTAGARLAYEAASIKPNVSGSGSSRTNGTRGQIVFTNVTLKALITSAFRVKPFQVVGPGWLETVRFDISAKYPPDTQPADRQVMLRNLLEERFQMAVHTETKEMSGYALVAAKSGFKLQPVKPGDTNTSTNSDGKVLTLKASSMSMERLADTVGRQLSAAVVDRTGIEGVFDIELKWNLDDVTATTDPDAPPSIFTALQELGLRLQAQKVPVEMIVVDRIERTPTEN